MRNKRGVVYGIFLTLAFAFVLLDTFVIPKNITAESDSTFRPPEITTAEITGEITAEPTTAKPVTPALPVITDTSYEDENISVKIETLRLHETNVHIADIKLSSAEYFKTAFANDKFGRNVTEITSDIAKKKNALFAINGDYYGFRDSGTVLRNGALYRKSGFRDALIMDYNGDLTIETEEVSDETLENAWQAWSFLPALVKDGEIVIDENYEISGIKTLSNPRTAIGQAGKLHYKAIVSEGRTEDNRGLTLYELAELFKEYGCETAYNLDGGGTSTMYFGGRLINRPTADGKTFKERKVSDIVYIGYE